jgi:hypothetical protein
MNFSHTTTSAGLEPRLLLLIGDDGAAGKLRRIPVALVTRGFKGKQQYRLTVEDLRDIVRNFRKRQTGDVVIDYDHSTLNAGDGEPKPAAGWLKGIDDEPDENGVLWGHAEYTQRASKMVAAKEYKYASPVIEWRLRDKTTGQQQGATLTSLALTNSPLFERLPSLPLVACESVGWKFDRGGVFHREENGNVAKRVNWVSSAGASARTSRGGALSPTTANMCLTAVAKGKMAAHPGMPFRAALALARLERPEVYRASGLR